MRVPVIAGNWKMNGLQQSATELAGIIEGIGPLATRMDILVCTPEKLAECMAQIIRG